ncbi:MAG: phosphate butyryltransferase [Candidatus Riflebacteria bacterium]|nr:phosphate butyryltransferase [Candidatus Riflebacteria bacterium]
MTSSFFEDLTKNAGKVGKARIAVPMAEDEAVAYAVERGVRDGFIDAVLIGDSDKISVIYADLASSKNVTIVHETDSVKACKIAVSMVREGRVDLLMKGLVPTSTILKAILNSEAGLKKSPLLSHITFFELKEQPGMRMITDVGINIAPDPDALEKIVRNAIEAFHLFKPDIPKVALLSANEKVSDKIPGTVLAQAVAAKFSGCMEAIVEGPVSLDLSVSAESARIKKYKGKIQGDADILVVPRIEVGNVLYKSLQYFSGANLGGVVFGAQCPVVLTSRSDSNETKFFSLLLGVTLWRNARSGGS